MYIYRNIDIYIYIDIDIDIAIDIDVDIDIDRYVHISMHTDKKLYHFLKF